MLSKDELKARALTAIDGRKGWIENVAKTILDNPEVGFQEIKTSRLVSEKLAELNVPHENGIAITGIRGRLTGGAPGPTVAIIGELDSLVVPDHSKADPETGAAHACGHHAQIAMMLGGVVGLLAPEVMSSLSGNVAPIAVPAEEFVQAEYRWKLHQQGKLGLMSGKQEFIRLGAFDDVDMAMMVHTTAGAEERKISLGGTSTAHLVKVVQFIGKAAHAGGAPFAGVNALQAAMLALNAINAQRETFRDQDTVRVHGIITRGGTSVNAVPDNVSFEGRVRGRTGEVVEDSNAKVDRCLKAGALAIGAKVKIVTIPGYFPMVNNEIMVEVFKENAIRLVGEDQVVTRSSRRSRGGSTDMGDLSQIMPAIHPYAGGVTGRGHAPDYLISNYETAVVNPAKIMAMTVIDLLYDGAAGAKEVLAKSRPALTKRQYLAQQQQRLREELYEGK